MKKLITACLITVMALSLAACGAKTDKVGKKAPTSTTTATHSTDTSTTATEETVQTTEPSVQSTTTEETSSGRQVVEVTFEPYVDPRYIAKNITVYLEFKCLETADRVSITLYAYNNYRGTICVPEGTYGGLFFSTSRPSCVDEYGFPEVPSFIATGSKITVKPVFGDPNCIDDLPDDNEMPGGVNFDETNKELVENGQRPIDVPKREQEVAPTSTAP